MSGIAGVIHFDGAPVAPGWVEKMTAAMAYRGPDGIHHRYRGSVALGHCMLHTTPESLVESQPLANDDESLVLVMDGRVDNWEEMRRLLLGQGSLLRDRSDAELVLRAYEAWGGECLNRIEGDFAIVIWDARRQEAFCARDRTGNKPFNYHWNGNALVFASELHPLLAIPGVPQVPNEGMLAEFLAGEWHARSETLWHGIMRLAAAHRMVVGRRGPRLDRYWAPDLETTLPYRKDEEYFEHYRELLTDSVRRLSRSHRPVAVEVSGGLDSSAVFCIAEGLRRRHRLPAPAIQGYTMTFADNGAAGELFHARAVAAYLGVAIHEVPGSIMPLSWYAEQARLSLDFPGFPNASMCLGMRERSSREGSRVTLTGEGGDAWLQGSRTYYAEELLAQRWSALSDCFRADARAFGAPQAMRWLARHGVFLLLPTAIQTAIRHLLRRPAGGPARDRYWLSRRMNAAIGRRCGLAPVPNAVRVRHPGQQELLENLDDAFTAQIIERLERDGARRGIEMRHPLRDPRLIQFAFSCPERLRLRGDTSKYIHVKALAGRVPEAVLERRDKEDFSGVFGRQLPQLNDRLTQILPRERADWVARDGAARLFQACQEESPAGWPLWILWGMYGCDEVLKQAARPRDDKTLAAS